MGMNRQPPRPAPRLDETIKALTRYGTTPEAADLLAAAEWITTTHAGEQFKLPNGTFGHCEACHEPWPCPTWNEIQALTLSWLISASTEAIRASQQNIRNLVAA